MSRSPQQRPRVCFSTSSLTLVLWFSVVAILAGVKLCLILVLIYNSLAMGDVGHLFICLVICTLSLEKCVFKPFSHF